VIFVYSTLFSQFTRSIFFTAFVYAVTVPYQQWLGEQSVAIPESKIGGPLRGLRKSEGGQHKCLSCTVIFRCFEEKLLWLPYQTQHKLVNQGCGNGYFVNVSAPIASASNSA